MAAIEIILQRMTWASCFCLALTLYSNAVPTRTLSTKLGETTQPHRELDLTYLAQRLGREISNRVESQSNYTDLLTALSRQHPSD
jgi:hypothetical protein